MRYEVIFFSLYWARMIVYLLQVENLAATRCGENCVGFDERLFSEPPSFMIIGG